jgi:hypothetical protein
VDRCNVAMPFAHSLTRWYCSLLALQPRGAAIQSPVPVLQFASSSLASFAKDSLVSSGLWSAERTNTPLLW